MILFPFHSQAKIVIIVVQKIKAHLHECFDACLLFAVDAQTPLQDEANQTQISALNLLRNHVEARMTDKGRVCSSRV